MIRFRQFAITSLALFDFAVFAHCESTASGNLELFTIVGPHYKISWSAPLARLRAVGLWDSRHEPRVSIKDAVSIARRYLKSHGQPDQLPLLWIALRRPQKGGNPPTEFYFYFITFDDPHYIDPAAAQDVVVLLDGSIVEPARTKT